MKHEKSKEKENKRNEKNKNKIKIKEKRTYLGSCRFCRFADSRALFGGDRVRTFGSDDSRCCTQAQSSSVATR